MANHVDVQLEQISARAQSTADREGHATAVYNLNGAGRRLLVIREYQEGSIVYAGPFEPAIDFGGQDAIFCRHCGADLPEGITPKGEPDCPACGRDN